MVKNKRGNSEQQRVQDGTAQFNFVSKAEILNLIDVKKGVQVFDHKTLRKQNVARESSKNIKLKKHISEKMFEMYRNELKRAEKSQLGQMRKKQVIRAKSQAKKLM